LITAGVVKPLSDGASKEGVLVHEVGLIVSAAGHFFREVLKYDEGIGGEIEFRVRRAEATAGAFIFNSNQATVIWFGKRAAKKSSESRNRATLNTGLSNPVPCCW
jgi:hypothetical protein